MTNSKIQVGFKLYVVLSGEIGNGGISGECQGQRDGGEETWVWGPHGPGSESQLYPLTMNRP